MGVVFWLLWRFLYYILQEDGGSSPTLKCMLMFIYRLKMKFTESLNVVEIVLSCNKKCKINLTNTKNVNIYNKGI